MRLSVIDLKDNLVEFKVHPMLNAKTLWMNSKKLFALDGSHWSSHHFLQAYGYGIKGNEFFEDIIFDESEPKTLSAERYGGKGIGTNGGGARSGTDGFVQIKGTGKNPLANTQSHWHGYGGLNMVDAIYETINAIVLGKLLPLGVVEVYGIITTGNNTAMLPGMEDKELEERRSYGALLVREACVRPAHFFRAFHFKPAKDNPHKFLNETCRVRNVNQLLGRQFANDEAFFLQVDRYIANYANQFAFARAARIAHGSITSSNIGLDGKWLDLSNTTFLDGGRNTFGGTSFYNEPKAINNMLEEFIYTFSKYNQSNLNPAAFLKYYAEQFKSYFIMHTSYVIGIDYAMINGGVENPNLGLISDTFSKAIASARATTTERPCAYKENDPVLCLIEGLFSSLQNIYLANTIFNMTAVRYGNHTDIISAFSSLMQSVYSNIKHLDITYKSFIIATAIIALKRSLVAEYFYMARLENYIYRMVKDKKEELFAEVINDSVAVADWAFNLRECLSTKLNMADVDSYAITIMKTPSFALLFEVNANRYAVFNVLNNTKRYFEHYNDALNLINRENYELTISEYSFSKYLIRLGATLSTLEKYKG
jgi:hypothetical protein